MTALDKFLAVAPPIDDFREEAARVCEETARYERGERAALRLDPNDIANNEFSDSAAGIAAEVATTVSAALKRSGMAALVCPEQVWNLAANLLRGGWQRSHRLQPMVTRGEPSGLARCGGARRA